MHEQLVAPHKANTGRDLEVQTDKEKYKIVPCTNAGCNVDLVVNVFYAPYKGKCNAHGDKKPSQIAASHLVHQSGEGATPNGSLAKLQCPLCQSPLMIVKINDAGWLTFRCTDGTHLTLKDVAKMHNDGTTSPFCGAAIEVRPHWGALEMSEIPDKWKDLVEMFNIGARMEYFDAQEAKNASN